MCIVFIYVIRICKLQKEPLVMAASQFTQTFSSFLQSAHCPPSFFHCHCKLVGIYFSNFLSIHISISSEHGGKGRGHTGKVRCRHLFINLLSSKTTRLLLARLLAECGGLRAMPVTHC